MKRVPGSIASARTGAGAVQEPPRLPELTSVDSKLAASWSGGVNRWLSVEVAHDGILIGDNGGAFGDVVSVADLLLGADAEASFLTHAPAG
jgi:hypothetical protein